MQKKVMLFRSLTGLAVALSLLAFACSDSNNELATVSGAITFDNVAQWPDSGEVQITIWAENVWTAFGPMGPPQSDAVVLTKSGNQNQFNYSFAGLPEGAYSAIAVGWRHPDESLPATERSAVLGVFLNDPSQVSTGLIIPNTPFQGPLPATFTLAKGEQRGSMDVRADFANLVFFFPPN